MNTPIEKFVLETTPDELYKIVQWPDVQDLMEYDWFRSESILYQPFEDQVYLDSAYFVPLQRLFEISEEHANNEEA